MTQDSKLSRRQVIGGALALGAGGILLKNGVGTASTASAAAADGPRHLVWVWQFSSDASPEKIGIRLLDHNLGILLKTHDGIEWMAEYDKNAYAVSGPAQVKTLAEYYEKAGVPFHAWTVVHGSDPIREARMAADVIGAGARSIWLDVEGGSGFWRGTTQDAVAFGREFRRLQPNAKVVLSIDPRPWTLKTGYPLAEFAAFSDAIAPQQYWRTFSTPANVRKFQESGFPVPPEGITPEFLVAVGKAVLSPFGKPLIQVGQGATPEKDEFKRFIDASYNDGSDMVTVWRFGVTSEDVFKTLLAVPPKKPPPPPAAAAASGTLTAAGTYVVASGDSLSKIAASQGVSVVDLANINGLAEPYTLYVGQELKIPGAAGGGATSAYVAPAAATGGGGQTYVVQSGDTLGGIGAKFGSTADAIAQANGLADVNSLSVGQELKIP